MSEMDSFKSNPCYVPEATSEGISKQTIGNENDVNNDSENKINDNEEEILDPYIEELKPYYFGNPKYGIIIKPNSDNKNVEKESVFKEKPAAEGDSKQKMETEDNANNQSENKINDNAKKGLSNPFAELAQKQNFEWAKKNINNQSENNPNNKVYKDLSYANNPSK